MFYVVRPLLYSADSDIVLIKTAIHKVNPAHRIDNLILPLISAVSNSLNVNVMRGKLFTPSVYRKVYPKYRHEKEHDGGQYKRFPYNIVAHLLPRQHDNQISNDPG